MASQTDWSSAGCGEYPVTVIPDYRITLKDGTKISLKIWYPSSRLENSPFAEVESYTEWNPYRKQEAEKREQEVQEPETPMEKPLPVILEYLPYRHSDYTVKGDFNHHTWICSHGYVCVRADFRGCGLSGGLYFGEYLAQEQEDGLEVVAWLAAQPWSSGDVGMSGHSWGGFNGLQVAFHRPPALKAIITVYSTDDRYASDLHIQGGALLGADGLAWSNRMFIYNMSPPNPRFEKDWRRVWMKRLESASAPWIRDWLHHQTRDEYWKHASTIQDKSRIHIPVLAVGGFQDGYRDTVFRLAEYMPNFKGILGPWSHLLPYYPQPGPAIHYSAECLKWWDYHLKGIHNNTMETPLLRLYLQEGLPPQGSHSNRPGRWVTESEWPPSAKNHDRYLTLALDNSNMSLVKSNVGDNVSLARSTKVVGYDGRAGLGGSKWFLVGAPDELARDQAPTEGYGRCWCTGVLGEDTALLGQARLDCTVSVENSDSGILAARICEIFPDGQSTLLALGILNLNHYQGHDPEKITALSPGKRYKVKVDFKAMSCVVAKGNRISLGISSSYFPQIWPSKDPVQLGIHTGSDSDGPLTKLTLPVRPLDMPSETVTFKGPIDYPSVIDTLVDPHYTKNIKLAQNDGDQSVYQIDESRGKFLIKPTRTIMTGVGNVDTYTIDNKDPLSARVTVKNSLDYDWPDGDCSGSNEPIRVSIRTTGELWADRENFFTKHEANVKLNDDLVFQKTWDDSYPRHFC